MMKIAKLSASRHFNSSTIKHAGRAFLADRKATTAVEFAMIAVPFFGLIGAVFETGAVYFKTAQLQHVTESVSRNVLTNSLTVSMTNNQFRDTYVCPKLGALFTCSNIMIDISSPASWGAANTANDFYSTYTSSNKGAASIAIPGQGQIAVVRIAYPMPQLMAILSGGAFAGQTIAQTHAGQVQYNSSWNHMLLGVFAFRVEPN
jgi:Flp pilus assembly protein TadG